MHLRTALPFLVLPILATSAPALAQSVDPEAQLDPVFPTMGPDGAGSSISAELGIVAIDEADETIETFDLRAQFAPQRGAGFYAGISGTRGFDDVHLGSLELGALSRIDGDTTDITLRAGVILPTSSMDDDEFFGGAFTHLYAKAVTRPSDYLTSVPDATTLRFAIQPSWRQDNLVARGEVGLDVVVASEGEVPDAPFLHVDVGGGYHDGKFGLIGELSTMVYLEESEETIHVAALTGEVVVGKATPYLTLSRPFGEWTEDGEVGTNVLLGVRGRL